MKCSEARRHILDGHLTPEVRQHAAQCADCAAFLKEIAQLREVLKRIPSPAPDEQLVAKTQARCRAELKKNMRRSRFNHLSEIPQGIWFVSFSLILLTVLWIPMIFHYSPALGKMSWPVVVGFLIILQNLISLILSPLLLRTDFPLNNE